MGRTSQSLRLSPDGQKQRIEASQLMSSWQFCLQNRTQREYLVWYARIEGRATAPRIGIADVFADANGKEVFNWKQAQAEARKLAERGPAPSARP